MLFIVRWGKSDKMTRSTTTTTNPCQSPMEGIVVWIKGILKNIRAKWTNLFRPEKNSQRGSVSLIVCGIWVNICVEG